MNGELLAAIERLEREKGISKDVLFSAIESALTSAAYKIIGDPELSRDEIVVEMDKETGEISVFKGDEEVDSEQLGRIAAQTAKQVMIQKIREAERDVIFDKYMEKEGEIISGAVHRFEKGNIIVELDEVEALLPKSEQIPRERFRQGEMIRAYLAKVERRTGGLDIILSRACDGFVKKLFELEVPEITQGIVEIVSVAREAGERTKISVHSKEDKIDSVGACVGMRGSRVKEIVKELSGERIDIVRWSDDLQEYVKAAVSPVEIYGMEIDRENHEIRLTVTKDQLSLLIGKKGRNIRLASKLLGWDLRADAVVENISLTIYEIDTLDGKVKEILEAAGMTNVSEILNSGSEGLREIEGIDEDMSIEIVKTCEAALEATMSAEEDEKGDSQAGEEKEVEKTEKTGGREAESGGSEGNTDEVADDNAAGEETGEAPGGDGSDAADEKKDEDGSHDQAEGGVDGSGSDAEERAES